MSVVIPNELLSHPLVRFRRLRQHPALRELISEHRVSVRDLIQPLFIKEGTGIRQAITSMPECFQYSADQLDDELQRIAELKIPGIILFGIPGFKDHRGSAALQRDGVIPQAIEKIKKCYPQLLIIADLCFCEYTDHGHCGVIHDNYWGQKDIDNDRTLVLLAEQAKILAQAGADVIAPSGMIDGMVHAIRSALDSSGYSELPILSYAVKFASSFYGPFREAAEGAPQFGDRQTYQMSPSNGGIALRETEQDLLEGADMLIVKPAHTYLDILYRVKQKFPGVPLGAYHVSGEYAMIKAAARNGWLDEKKCMMECTIAMKRAGADFIITYFAKDIAEQLKE